MAVTQTPVRRRRRPEEAEAEILEAARELLSERPWSEVTVGAVMERTTLSRKSFYVYFRDRYELITRLVAPLRARGDEAMDPGLRPVALLEVARMYQQHGVLLRALQEASRHDPEAARAWREFTEWPIARLAGWIREEIDAGRIEGIDPEGTARALVGMNLYAFFDRLVGDPEADVEALVAQLDRVWERTLWLGPRPK